MVTAETLTDEQLGQLVTGGDLKIRALVMAARRVCYTARQRAARDEALAKCAAAWNARHGGGR